MEEQPKFEMKKVWIVTSRNNMFASGSVFDTFEEAAWSAIQNNTSGAPEDTHAPYLIIEAWQPHYVPPTP
jgi:hypothetical protein